MLFEWDSEKEKANIKKHGLDFSTAALVFGDDNRIEWYDARHSEIEDRYITIGAISGTIIIIVLVYTERSDAIRIISARKANEREERKYYGYY